jgi:hypothetical protein
MLLQARTKILFSSYISSIVSVLLIVSGHSYYLNAFAAPESLSILWEWLIEIKLTLTFGNKQSQVFPENRSFFELNWSSYSGSPIKQREGGGGLCPFLYGMCELVDECWWATSVDVNTRPLIGGNTIFALQLYLTRVPTIDKWWVPTSVSIDYPYSIVLRWKEYLFNSIHVVILTENEPCHRKMAVV